MEFFNLTLTQMLSMFALIIAGFIIQKLNLIHKDSDKVISKLETLILAPALSLSNQAVNCTPKNFSENFSLIFYGLIIVLLAIALSYPLSRLFIKGDSKELVYRRQIYKYALTFGNYGYMGNFIVLGIWGDMMFFRYSMFNFFTAIMCTAWGIYILIPKEHSKGNILKNLKRGLINPPFIALLIGMILGLTGIGPKLPPFISTALSNAGNCMGPVAMVLAGIVIGKYNFKELISDKKVYIVTFLRLIVIPSAMALILKLINTPKDIIILALITYATPLGLNTIIYPASYGGETKTGASMTMISHVLSVITIPVMCLIFLVLW